MQAIRYRAGVAHFFIDYTIKKAKLQPYSDEKYLKRQFQEISAPKNFPSYKNFAKSFIFHDIFIDGKSTS